MESSVDSATSARTFGRGNTTVDDDDDDDEDWGGPPEFKPEDLNHPELMEAAMAVTGMPGADRRVGIGKGAEQADKGGPCRSSSAGMAGGGQRCGSTAGSALRSSVSSVGAGGQLTIANRQPHQSPPSSSRDSPSPSQHPTTRASALSSGLSRVSFSGSERSVKFSSDPQPMATTMDHSASSPSPPTPPSSAPSEQARLGAASGQLQQIRTAPVVPSSKSGRGAQAVPAALPLRMSLAEPPPKRPISSNSSQQQQQQQQQMQQQTQRLVQQPVLSASDTKGTAQRIRCVVPHLLLLLIGLKPSILLLYVL